MPIWGAIREDWGLLIAVGFGWGLLQRRLLFTQDGVGSSLLTSFDACHTLYCFGARIGTAAELSKSNARSFKLFPEACIVLGERCQPKGSKYQYDTIRPSIKDTVTHFMPACVPYSHMDPLGKGPSRCNTSQTRKLQFTNCSVSKEYVSEHVVPRRSMPGIRKLWRKRPTHLVQVGEAIKMYLLRPQGQDT